MDKLEPKPNSTAFGEVIPTNFAWVPPDKQREIANKLEHLDDERPTS